MPIWGESDGKQEKVVKALHNKVCIRKLEKYHERTYGPIVVPVSSDINARMTKGGVISIGPEAMKDLEGLHVGDRVLYDHFGACADTDPIVIVPAENIICKVEEDDETDKETK